jgi:hypothetical protein
MATAVAVMEEYRTRCHQASLDQRVCTCVQVGLASLSGRKLAAPNRAALKALRTLTTLMRGISTWQMSLMTKLHQEAERRRRVLCVPCKKRGRSSAMRCA